MPEKPQDPYEETNGVIRGTLFLGIMSSILLLGSISAAAIFHLSDCSGILIYAVAMAIWIHFIVRAIKYQKQKGGEK